MAVLYEILPACFPLLPVLPSCFIVPVYGRCAVVCGMLSDCVCVVCARGRESVCVTPGPHTSPTLLGSPSTFLVYGVIPVVYVMCSGECLVLKGKKKTDLDSLVICLCCKWRYMTTMLQCINSKSIDPRVLDSVARGVLCVLVC